MNRVPKIIGVLCLLAWMSACSSSGSIQIATQMTGSIPPGSTVSLSVTAALPDDADDDTRKDVEEVIPQPLPNYAPLDIHVIPHVQPADCTPQHIRELDRVRGRICSFGAPIACQ